MRAINRNFPRHSHTAYNYGHYTYKQNVEVTCVHSKLNIACLCCDRQRASASLHLLTRIDIWLATSTRQSQVFLATTTLQFLPDEREQSQNLGIRISGTRATFLRNGGRVPNKWSGFDLSWQFKYWLHVADETGCSIFRWAHLQRATATLFCKGWRRTTHGTQPVAPVL